MFSHETHPLLARFSSGVPEFARLLLWHSPPNNAGERAAIVYSIIESCRRHGMEPYTYMHHVLTPLPSMTNRQIKDVVPKAGQQSGNQATISRLRTGPCR